MEGYEISTDQIRAVVRETLKDVFAKSSTKYQRAESAQSCQLMKEILSTVQSKHDSSVAVNIGSDEQLNSFVHELAKCLQDRNVEALILSGRLKFNLKKNSKKIEPSAQQQEKHKPMKVEQRFNQVEMQIDKGVLTETKIASLAKQTKKIIIGKRVVLTPLAKDRARTAKLEIVRK